MSNFENTEDECNDQNHNLDFSDLIITEDITKDELAAAYLTLFFDAKVTQTALATTIKLFNITSSIKLPSSFDGLLNILVNKSDLLDFKKTWFCGCCLKLITALENRSQRLCSKCNTR